MAQNNAFKEVTMNFNLRDCKARKCTSVICVIAYDGKQYRFSTNQQVSPQQWDKKQQKAILSPMITQAQNDNNFKVNEEIKRLKFAFDDFSLYVCKHGTNEIRAAIGTYFKDNKENNNYMSKAFNKNALFGSAFRAVLEKKGNVSKGTITNLNSQFKVIMEFVGKDNVVVTNNQYLINDFIVWAQKQGRKSSNISNILGLFKSIINEIMMNPKTRNLGVVAQVFENPKKDEKVSKTEKRIHFELTDEEVQRIKTQKVKNEKLENVRLAYCIMLCSGLRHSDLLQTIEKVNQVKEGEIAVIESQKTKVKAYVTATKELKELCEKCADFGQYKYIFGNEFNKLLKALASELNLKRERNYTEEGKKKIGLVCDLITSHCARVTKATKSVRNGVNKDIIIKEQGWNDDKVLNEIYAQVTEEDEINRLKQLKNKEQQKKEIANSMDNELSKAIDEYKRVLSMLKVDSALWFDCNSIDTLSRMVHEHEENISREYGVDYKTIKEIFNNSSTIHEQRAKLDKLIKGI